ncbi:MAG: hypothetical protein JW807_04690 [Spirochaetes bacterium]|nr:hypothetical protein [Spirochaetota bacterium]
MKIGKYFLFIMCMVALVSFSSCSSEKDKWFSQNDPSYNGFKLFDIFDGYPAITDAWDKVEDNVFNEGLRALIADTPVPTLQRVLGLLDDLVLLEVITAPHSPADPSRPLFDTLEGLGAIMNRIVDQDDLDEELDLINPDKYYDNFVSFMDDLSDTNANLSADLMPVVSGLLGYINRVHEGEITTITEQLKYMLAEKKWDVAGGAPDPVDPLDPDQAQNLQYFLPLIQGALAKMLLINDSYMDITGAADAPGAGNTFLGNTVEGIDLLLQGLNAVAAEDSEVTDYLVDVLIEAGRLTSKDANGKLFGTVLKELLCNLEDYFTIGGAQYGAVSPGNNNEYHRDQSLTYTDHYTADIYFDTELTNGVKELWPALQLLMIRSQETGEPGADYSILYDPDGKSPLEAIGASLGQLLNAGIDYGDDDYALEDSLKQMVELNGVGEDRRATDVSYLDHLLFTLSVSYNFGYKTVLTDVHDPVENHYHGHGVATNGVLTLNDSMYNLRSSDFLTLNAYTLALDKRKEQGGYAPADAKDGGHIGRSSGTFTGNDLKAGDHRFFMGYDFPAFLLLPAACAGDAGIPNGGEAIGVPETSTVTNIDYDGDGVDEEVHETGTDESVNDYRSYFPKVANGIGELNTAAVMMGMIARVCWEGEGPYYSTAGASNAGNVYTYYRPGGAVYANVTKPSSDPSTWTYVYPVDAACGMDAADPESAGQRWNRYREKLDSDYYLTKVGFLEKYCPAPVNGSASDYLIGTAGTDKYRMKEGDLSVSAQKFEFWEKVWEKSSARECATQEEAMYRNFQWLINEKKFVFIIPMWIESLGLNSAAYLVVESNGLAGLANGHKGYHPNYPAGYDPDDETNIVKKGLGCWNIQALETPFYNAGDPALSDPEGLSVVDAAEQTRRQWGAKSVNFGDSHEPADFRIMVFCREDPAVTVDLIWTNILGKGHLLPDVIGQNFGPVSRMAFMQEGPTLASDASGSTWSDAWENRSRLFPVVVAAVANLHERSYYKTAATGNNYNYAEKSEHIYPIRTVLAGLIPPLAKPRMWRAEGLTAKSSVINDQPLGVRWVPRVRQNSGEVLSESLMTYLTPAAAIYPATVDLRPRYDVKSLTSVLTENNQGQHNGLIPLMTETRAVSRLIAMLQRAEGPVVDPEKRKKIYRGIEQLLTSMKVTPGESIALGHTEVDYSNRQFLFGKRATDIDIDSLLDEVIGKDDVISGPFVPGKGLAAMVDRREPGVVKDYYDAHFPIAVRGGTTTAIFGDTLTDSAAAWLQDQYAGYKIIIGDRSGAPETLTIVSNDATTLTLSAASALTGAQPYVIVQNESWGWSNFDKMMNGMRSLLADDGPNGTAYYAMGNVANLLNKILTRVHASDDQLTALRHTLGILFAKYNSGTLQWETTGELPAILFDYLPNIMEVFDGHYEDLMLVAYNLFQEGGIMPVTVSGLSTSASWSQVFTELDLLLKDPFFNPWYGVAPGDPPYSPSLWLGKNSLIELMVDMADMLGKDWYTRLVFLGPGSYVIPYNSILEDEGEAIEFNPYKTLGTVLSTGGQL